MSTFIPVAEAAAMTARYRANRETILQTGYQNENILPVCETFDKTQIEVLLNRSGCAQLRCYYGMDEDQRVHLILVGVNANNEDMLPDALLQEEEDEFVVERATRCPDFCPPPSGLNS